MENQYFVNELRASFLLRKRKSRKPTSIYMSIYIGKKQFKFPLKVRVYPDHWSHKLQKAFTSNILCELDNKNNQIVNCKIDEYRERFNAFKNYLCNNSNEINRREAILKRYLKRQIQHYIIQKIRVKTVIHYTMESCGKNDKLYLCV